MRRVLFAVCAVLVTAGLAWLPARFVRAGEENAHGAGTKAEQGAGQEMTGHSHEKAMRHHGKVAMTKDHHFETVFTPDGIRIYIYTASQAPLMVEKAGGTVTLAYKDGRKKEIPLVAESPAKGEAAVYFCPMHEDVVQMEPGTCPKCQMTLYQQDRLFARAELAAVKPGLVKVVPHIIGLEGDEKEATFTETLGSMSDRPAPAAGSNAAAGGTSSHH